MAKTKKQLPEASISESPATPVDSVVATPKIITSDGVKKPAEKLPGIGKRFLWLWIVIGIVLISGGAVVYMMMYPTSNTTNTNTVTNIANQNTNTVVQVPRAIDGVLVNEGEEQPNLVAVMIENSSDARPQSGLDKAAVVYEALAEGGITRYMAIAPKTTDAKEFGPVRSARPYFVSYASAYHPLYVHAGGSPQALSMLATSSAVIDLNL